MARGLLPGVWLAKSSLLVLHRNTTCAAFVAAFRQVQKPLVVPCIAVLEKWSVLACLQKWSETCLFPNVAVHTPLWGASLNVQIFFQLMPCKQSIS